MAPKDLLKWTATCHQRNQFTSHLKKGEVQITRNFPSQRPLCLKNSEVLRSQQVVSALFKRYPHLYFIL